MKLVFVVYADGKPIIVDMGNKRYTAKTFGPDRYTPDNTCTMNHNVPLIGGVERHEGREYCAENVSADGHGASMDIAAAYPPEAGARRIRREFIISEQDICLHDVIDLDEEREVTWAFMLRKLEPGSHVLVCAVLGSAKQTSVYIPGRSDSFHDLTPSHII